jgi:hypothetical protein
MNETFNISETDVFVTSTGDTFKVVDRKAYSALVQWEDLTQHWLPLEVLEAMIKKDGSRKVVPNKEAESPPDVRQNVDSPKHYEGTYGMECIDSIRNALDEEEFIGYCKGNMHKYLWRAKHKNGKEDYEKAGVYYRYMMEDLDE